MVTRVAESEFFGWSRIPNNTRSRSRAGFFCATPTTEVPLDHFLYHAPKLGIPVEMVQFLMNLLLKQRILAVYHDFPWALVAVLAIHGYGHNDAKYGKNKIQSLKTNHVSFLKQQLKSCFFMLLYFSILTWIKNAFSLRIVSYYIPQHMYLFVNINQKLASSKALSTVNLIFLILKLTFNPLDFYIIFILSSCV